MNRDRILDVLFELEGLLYNDTPDYDYVEPPAARSQTGLGNTHLRWMIQEMRTKDLSIDKLNRWLGYIQGVLVTTEQTTLTKMKELNRKKPTKLTGNPNSIDTGEGDFSFGYIAGYHEDYWKETAENPESSSLIEDVCKIVYAYQINEFEITPSVAFYIWDEYSSSLNAHWIVVPNDDQYIIEVTSKFLIETIKR